jgi:hypothetical protein
LAFDFLQMAFLYIQPRTRPTFSQHSVDLHTIATAAGFAFPINLIVGTDHAREKRERDKWE